MAKVNREFTPAVMQLVAPAKEVFHLELTPEEMAFIYLLIGNVRGGASGTYGLYQQIKLALGFEECEQNTVELSRPDSNIYVVDRDVKNLLSKRQK